MVIAACLAGAVLGTTLQRGSSPVRQQQKQDPLWKLRGGDIEEGQPAAEHWDYIIVGAGAAGCVLADRLTADGTNRVLMLEAGTDASRDLRIRVPAGLVKVFKSERDWDFETEPVEGTGRGVYLCRGKCTGGSSSTNVMLYHRGTPADYESWVAKGAVGWGAADVLEYYRKSEDNLVDGASQYHGTGGPVPVDDVPYINPLSEAFLDAAGSLGYRRQLDFNDWSAPQDGFGRFKVTQRNGERCSAWNAYMTNSGAKKRGNLKVTTGVHVTKVSLEGSDEAHNLCASGVEYVDASGNPACAQLNAGGEVLMAAGAVQSPQILMLSGLGPKAHLESVGVEVKKDMAGVGEGLQDHPAVLVSYGSKKAVSVTDDIRLFGSGMTNPITLFKWLTAGKGALTSVACEFGGFFRSSKDQSQPDIQVRFIAARAMSADGISTLEKFGSGQRAKSGYTTQIIAVRPKSAGSVKLRSADPLAKPLLLDVHLSDEADVKTLREGIKLGRKLATAPSFDQYREEEVYPSPAVQSDADIESYVRSSVHSGNALTGSCRMGRDGDAGAVLDPELRVRGVGSLRVIDASAMPHIIGGQTAAPTYMIAEKGADLVLRQRAILKSYSQQAERQAAHESGMHAEGEAPMPAPGA